MSLPLGKSHFATLSLQWRHTSVMAPEITVRLTICSTACHDWEQKKYPSTSIGDVIICNTEIAFCSIVITGSSHERHGVPNHSPLDNLLNGMSWLRAKETFTPFNWERNHLYYRNRILQHCHYREFTWVPWRPKSVCLTICSTACHDWEQKKHPHILIGNKIICNPDITFWNDHCSGTTWATWRFKSLADRLLVHHHLSKETASVIIWLQCIKRSYRVSVKYFFQHFFEIRQVNDMFSWIRWNHVLF